MLVPMRDNITVCIDESIPSAARFGFLVASKTDGWRSKDGAIESENRGVVMQIGPGRKSNKTGDRIPMLAKVGDTIRFGELEYASESINGRKHVLISEKDILWIEETV